MRIGRHATALAAALLLGLAGCGPSGGDVAGGVGTTLPSVELDRVGGGRETLDVHRGRTVVLNVWATWCPPCRAEMPTLQALSRTLDPERFVVVGVAVDEAPGVVGEYLRRTGVAYPNYTDPEQELTRGGLAVERLPETLVVDRKGRIVARVVGAEDWSHPERVAWLRQLDAETEGRP